MAQLERPSLDSAQITVQGRGIKPCIGLSLEPARDSLSVSPSLSPHLPPSAPLPCSLSLYLSLPLSTSLSPSFSPSKKLKINTNERSKCGNIPQNLI